MKIAIVGAGFCGLSLAHLLLSLRAGEYQVTLFDHKGIGGGASGVATGLLHPYPGEQGRRSWMATEAMAATGDLLQQVAKETGRSVASYGGIIRVAQNEEQIKAFTGHIQTYQDMEQIDERSFLIRSGITVHCHEYLQGLWEMIQQQGGTCENRHISTLAELEEYDRIVLASGSGTLLFKETAHLGLKQVKGQVLEVEMPKGYPGLSHSMIGKGYAALSEKPDHCYLGSTYEKSFTSEEADRTVAQELIFAKFYPSSVNGGDVSHYLGVQPGFPPQDQLKVVGCRAGIRLSRIGHYRPIVEQLSPKVWVFTAMGSRGLLYHAYFAHQLLNAFS